MRHAFAEFATVIASVGLTALAALELRDNGVILMGVRGVSSGERRSATLAGSSSQTLWKALRVRYRSLWSQ